MFHLLGSVLGPAVDLFEHEYEPGGGGEVRLVPVSPHKLQICCPLELSGLSSETNHNLNYISNKGLRPYYVISYNKQGSFQMITDDYNNGPRVVRKDYVLWKIQNMQESASMPSSSGQSQFSIMSLMTLKLKLKN